MSNVATTSENVRVFSTVEAAMVQNTVGARLISASMNAKKRADGSIERAAQQWHCWVPMECVSAPEAGEIFRPLVESVLIAAAQAVLKEAQTNASAFLGELPVSIFNRVALTERAQGTASRTWFEKEALEDWLNDRPFWQGIRSKPEFKNSPEYRRVASRFFDTILALAGKRTQLPKAAAQKILSYVPAEDFENTEVGRFVFRRVSDIVKYWEELEAADTAPL